MSSRVFLVDMPSTEQHTFLVRSIKVTEFVFYFLVPHAQSSLTGISWVDGRQLVTLEDGEEKLRL